MKSWCYLYEVVLFFVCLCLLKFRDSLSFPQWILSNRALCTPKKSIHVSVKFDRLLLHYPVASSSINVCFVVLSQFLCFQQSAPLPICGECLGTAAKNRLGCAEPLSSCSECGSSVHLSCVGGGRGAELAALLAKGGRWFCEECRTCAGCNETADQASVLAKLIDLACKSFS